MRVSRLLPVALLLSSAAQGTPPLPPPAPRNAVAERLANDRLNAALPPEAAALRSHVMFLADDALKGREAGSPEYDIAAAYVAARFSAAGLRPAGDDGSFLQTVPLLSYKTKGQGALSLGDRQFVYGTEYLPSANPAEAETRVSAPVVFVGYGIDAPDRGQDAYAGVDVKGKIVAFLSGSPKGMNAEERAYLGSTRTKQRFAAARGAVGVVVLQTPTAEKVRPFARNLESIDHARMTWARADGSGNVDAPDTPVLASLSLIGAQKLLADSLVDWRRLTKEIERDTPRLKATALTGTLTAAIDTTFDKATSYNVAALLPGSDPAVADEVVVLSAHLDHVGVTKPVDGDSINNGALDDAIGIASLIEEAKRFRDGAKPRRSILFLAVTAEERGLIGSDYFAQHPTVPADRIVADVNLDMPILTFPFEDVVAFGGDRSTLGPIIAEAAKQVGVILSPDPMPDEAIFVRSDHFRFVERGVPSVFLWPGYKGAGEAAITDFMKNHYHKPSDDLSLPIDWQQGVRFVDLNYRIAHAIADAPARPVWRRGDYFGTLFKGPMAP